MVEDRVELIDPSWFEQQISYTNFNYHKAKLRKIENGDAKRCFPAAVKRTQRLMQQWNPFGRFVTLQVLRMPAKDISDPDKQMEALDTHWQIIFESVFV